MIQDFITNLLDWYFEKKVIVNCDRDPYLHRWYLVRNETVGIFVHRFVRSDEDRALHDHPWAFIVIPLWGGYIEHSDKKLKDCGYLEGLAALSYRESEFLPNGERRIKPLDLEQRVPVKRRVWPLISLAYRGTDYRHRVELIDGRHSWSIFIRFKKIREWGFWPKEGFTQWNHWWQNKCE